MRMPEIKLAVVTGASKGIGRDVGLLLSRQGVKVILLARSRDKLESVKNDIDAAGGECDVMVCDMEDREMIKSVASKVCF